MDCRAVERSLSSFLDGELDPRERLAVQVHLRRCPCCEQSYRKLSSITSCLHARRVSAPEDFSLTLQSRLRQLESRSLLSAERAGARVRRTLMLTAVAVAVMLAGGLFALVAWTQRHEQRLQVVARSASSERPVPWESALGSRPAISLVSLRGAPLLGPPPAIEALPQSASDQRPLARVSY